jgi:subtilase family serine protease
MKLKYVFFLIFFFLFFLDNVSAISVSMHIPEKYNSVEAGERLYFEVTVKYPENPSRVDLRLNYYIKNLDGDVIANAKALKAVETQASFIDFIVLPEGVESGIYNIDVEINDYGDMNEIVGSSFKIVSNREQKIIKYLYAISAGVIFLIILLVIDIFRRRF